MSGLLHNGTTNGYASLSGTCNSATPAVLATYGANYPNDGTDGPLGNAISIANRDTSGTLDAVIQVFGIHNTGVGGDGLPVPSGVNQPFQVSNGNSIVRVTGWAVTNTGATTAASCPISGGKFVSR